MDRPMEGKVAMITGAGQGIGVALMTRRGWHSSLYRALFLGAAAGPFTSMRGRPLQTC